MTATIKTYRDGGGTPFDGREWDDGTALSPMPVLSDGAGAELAKAEDAAAVSGDKGLVVLGVRRDSAASSSGTDGDYSTFNFDASGQLWVTGATTTTISAGATSIAKAEDVASANADVGVPSMAIQKASPADTAGTDGDYAMLQMSAGRLWASAKIDTALPAGTNTIGNIVAVPATSGGLSRSRTLIPNNTTAIVVKSGAGQLFKIRATNNSATIAYIKLYDATSATAGSGTPVDTIMIPASTSGAGIVDTTDLGIVHSTGITYTVTTGIADNDTGAPAASAYIVTLFYK